MYRAKLPMRGAGKKARRNAAGAKELAAVEAAFADSEVQTVNSIVLAAETQSKEAETRQALITELNQSEAVLGLQLGRLTSLDEANLANEQASLQQDIAYLKDLLDNDKSVYAVLKEELKGLGDKYAVPRRSEIDDDSGDGALNEQDLITNARSVVVVTRAGYIKRRCWPMRIRHAFRRSASCK